MLCLVDVPILVDSRPQTGWGHANGQINLSDHPAGHDRISIPHGIPEITKLGFFDPMPVGSVSDRMGHPFVMLDGVVAPDELAAARVAWLLWQRLGFSITPYERTVSPAWLAVRGGLHDRTGIHDQLDSGASTIGAWIWAGPARTWPRSIARSARPWWIRS